LILSFKISVSAFASMSANVLFALNSIFS
jgi:hypothetical protein